MSSLRDTYRRNYFYCTKDTPNRLEPNLWHHFCIEPLSVVHRILILPLVMVAFIPSKRINQTMASKYFVEIIITIYFYLIGLWPKWKRILVNRGMKSSRNLNHCCFVQIASHFAVIHIFFFFLSCVQTLVQTFC